MEYVLWRTFKSSSVMAHNRRFLKIERRESHPVTAKRCPMPYYLRHRFLKQFILYVTQGYRQHRGEVRMWEVNFIFLVPMPSKCWCAMRYFGLIWKYKIVLKTVKIITNVFSKKDHGLPPLQIYTSGLVAKNYVTPSDRSRALHYHNRCSYTKFLSNFYFPPIVGVKNDFWPPIKGG